MSDTKHDGGPVFPELKSFLQRDHIGRESDRFTYDAKVTPGMSLRDWFAGQVLPTLAVRLKEKDASRAAYKYADAMLAARTTPHRE
jgi:hypothetical protein